MPDLTVEVVSICPMWASNFDIQGSNDSKYLVQFHKHEPASCTCPSYKFSGPYGMQTCKHIKKIQKLGCFYHPQGNDKAKWEESDFDDNGIMWLNQTTDTVEEMCPGCGMPMTVVRTAV